MLLNSFYKVFGKNNSQGYFVPILMFSCALNFNLITLYVIFLRLIHLDVNYTYLVIANLIVLFFVNIFLNKKYGIIQAVNFSEEIEEDGNFKVQWKKYKTDILVFFYIIFSLLTLS
jgi:hypothetical protein